MRSAAEILAALSLTASVMGGVGYVYQFYGVSWAVGSFFLIWLIGPFLPLFAGIKDGYWVLAAWAYIPAALAVAAAFMSKDKSR